MKMLFQKVEISSPGLTESMLQELFRELRQTQTTQETLPHIINEIFAEESTEFCEKMARSLAKYPKLWM